MLDQKIKNRLKGIEAQLIHEFGSYKPDCVFQYGCKFGPNTLILFGLNHGDGKKFYIQIFYKGRFSGIRYMDQVDDVEEIYPSIQKGIDRLRPYLE